jgi:hypothetical protein
MKLSDPQIDRTKKAASSDANLDALTLMTQAQTVITDPFVQQQFAHLEALLRRIDLDTRNA